MAKGKDAVLPRLREGNTAYTIWCEKARSKEMEWWAWYRESDDEDNDEDDDFEDIRDLSVEENNGNLCSYDDQVFPRQCAAPGRRIRRMRYLRICSRPWKGRRTTLREVLESEDASYIYAMFPARSISRGRAPIR